MSMANDLMESNLAPLDLPVLVKQSLMHSRKLTHSLTLSLENILDNQRPNFSLQQARKAFLALREYRAMLELRKQIYALYFEAVVKYYCSLKSI
jgi:hypothetical protein